jgi:copper resistance protein C
MTNQKIYFFRIAFFVTMVFSQLVIAEGVLLKGIPEDNAQLSQFDGNINLVFSGNVSKRYPSLIVVNSKGQRVDNHDVKLEIASRSHLQASTQPLPPDHYTMRYRVVTDDGLVVSGIRQFSITQ